MKQHQIIQATLCLLIQPWRKDFGHRVERKFIHSEMHQMRYLVEHFKIHIVYLVLFNVCRHSVAKLSLQLSRTIKTIVKLHSMTCCYAELSFDKRSTEQDIYDVYFQMFN